MSSSPIAPQILALTVLAATIACSPTPPCEGRAYTAQQYGDTLVLAGVFSETATPAIELTTFSGKQHLRLLGQSNSTDFLTLDTAWFDITGFPAATYSASFTVTCDGDGPNPMAGTLTAVTITR